MKNERKEELKDEMKNRISLALKDTILQQGFEIICKENAELKKKNKELDVFLVAGSTFNKALNSQNRALEEDRDKYREMTFDMKEQLTKAKELLKKIDTIFYSGENALKRLSKISDTLAEAEQFLKERA